MVTGLVLCGLLCGCEPRQPSPSSWRDDAYHAVTDVESDVATAYLVIRELRRDNVAGNYAQVALVTAENDAGKKTQKFTAYQPPVGDDDRYDRVSHNLSDAGDLLTSARVAVVRRNDSAYAELEKQLARERARLDRLGTALGGVRG